MASEPWKEHEADMCQMFGVRPTITSGNKFYDPGDGQTTAHTPFAIFMDCKCTERASMSLKASTLQQYADRAASIGKRFIMPIRFISKLSLSGGRTQDWVLVQAHDLAELIEMVNAPAGGEEKVMSAPEPAWGFTANGEARGFATEAERDVALAAHLNVLKWRWHK